MRFMSEGGIHLGKIPGENVVTICCRFKGRIRDTYCGEIIFRK